MSSKIWQFVAKSFREWRFLRHYARNGGRTERKQEPGDPCWYGYPVYPNELYFSIIAQCRTTLLQKITGSIVWKYKTTGSYSKTKTISVNYQDDFGIPKYTLTCLKYTGKTFASGTTISADFNIDVDATGEISGGVVSRTVTGIVP